jgi:hypothetical protein
LTRLLLGAIRSTPTLPALPTAPTRALTARAQLNRLRFGVWIRLEARHHFNRHIAFDESLNVGEHFFLVHAH